MKKSLLAVVATAIIATLMLTACPEDNEIPSALRGEWTGIVPITAMRTTPDVEVDFPVTLTFTNNRLTIAGSQEIEILSETETVEVNTACDFTSTATTVSLSNCVDATLGTASSDDSPTYSIEGDILTFSEATLNLGRHSFLGLVTATLGGSNTFTRQ